MNDEKKNNSNQSNTKTYNHTAESFVPMELIGAYNIGQIMGNAFKNNSEKINSYEGMSAEELIAKHPEVMQRLLIGKNYDLGEYKDDGNWGNSSKRAWAQAQKDGWILKDGQLVKAPGKAFYISYPDHRISTSGTGLRRFFGDYIPLIKGHSASILIDSNGNATYHTYGRYGDSGSYKSWSLPTMKQNESNEVYLKRIRPYLEYTENKEKVKASYIPEIDYQKATEYYKQQPEKGNYSIFDGTTCAGEACRGIDAGTGVDSFGFFDWFIPDTPENIHQINYQDYEKINF